MAETAMTVTVRMRRRWAARLGLHLGGAVAAVTARSDWAVKVANVFVGLMVVEYRFGERGRWCRRPRTLLDLEGSSDAY